MAGELPLIIPSEMSIIHAGRVALLHDATLRGTRPHMSSLLSDNSSHTLSPRARNSRVTTSTSHWMTSQCGLREPLNRTSPACQMDGCSKVLDRHSAKQQI